MLPVKFSGIYLAIGVLFSLLFLLPRYRDYRKKTIAITATPFTFLRENIAWVIGFLLLWPLMLLTALIGFIGFRMSLRRERAQGPGDGEKTPQAEATKEQEASHDKPKAMKRNPVPKNGVAAWPYVLLCIVLLVAIPAGTHATLKCYFPEKKHVAYTEDYDSESLGVESVLIMAAIFLAIGIPYGLHSRRKKLVGRINDLTTAIQVAAFQNDRLIMDIRSADIDQQYHENEDLPMGLVLATDGKLEREEEFEFMGVNLYAGSGAWMDRRGYVRAALNVLEHLKHSSLYRHLKEVENLVDGVLDYQTRSECARGVRNYKLELMRDYTGCWLAGTILNYPGLAEKMTPESAVTKRVMNELYKNRLGFTPYIVHMSDEDINKGIRLAVKTAEEGEALASKAAGYTSDLLRYDRALAIDPKDAKVWRLKGNALRGLDRLEDALAAYDHALTVNPEDAEAWRDKGLVLPKLDRWEEGLIAFEHSLALDPKDDLAWEGKGVVLQVLGRYEEAVAAFDQTLAIDPDNAEARDGKTYVLGKLGRTE